MLYPLKYEPILMLKIWGGQKLKRLYNTDEYDNIGESWLVSAIAGNESIVKSGFLKDNSLSELVEVYLNDLVGNEVYRRYGNDFPLLVKVIDAADDLSIQVHPNDEIAKERHNSFGKNEMWYILENAVAFDRFLNRFVVRPCAEFFLFDKRKRRIVLFGERRRKIPRDHHIDIVFVRTYF